MSREFLPLIVDNHVESMGNRPKIPDLSVVGAIIDCMLYATHALVDLNRLGENARAIRHRVGKRALLVPVKANAYGHGAVEVAGYLQQNGLADYLAVATTPEALSLRDAGITLPILRLSPAFDEELRALSDARVSITVVDEVSAERAARAGFAAPVHLAIDTGMHRIGCRPGQALRVAQKITDLGLNLEGIFTHLPVSDVESGREYTASQLRVFNDAARGIQQARRDAGLAPIKYVHSANSGAVLGHDLGGINLVRPGILFYGYYPDATSPKTVEVRPALELKSRVSALRRISDGQTVSYGRTWAASGERWIATVPVGYADGYSRLLSNRGRMLSGGVSYPIAGRVCMDQTMFDLGVADESPLSVGDEVTLLGADGSEKITADEIADQTSTISYEVLASISPRVPRVYKTNAQLVNELRDRHDEGATTEQILDALQAERK